jgi:hypothetical protein
VGKLVSRAELVQMEEKRMHRERSGWCVHILSSSCKERNRAHPNMVSVHDRTQTSSSIDLFEVGGG